MRHWLRTLPICLIAGGLAGSALAADVVVQLGAGDGFAIEDSTATERFRVDEQGELWRGPDRIYHSPEFGSTFVGPNAGFFSTGTSNTALGSAALISNTSGSQNTAVGSSALWLNVGGNQNTAVGAAAQLKNETGTNNSAFGYQSLGSNVSGINNSAFGSFSLGNTTGSSNAGFGYSTLSSNVGGSQNSALGVTALAANVGQTNNTGVGFASLQGNATGNRNSAFGSVALDEAGIGDDNTALGFRSLTALTSGARNIGVGANSGSALTGGSDNIYIGNIGSASESGTIRIGSAATATHIDGINGTTLPSGTAVVVDANDRLGTLTSSIRFKQAVRGMGDESRVLMELRPVGFRYREEVVGAEGARIPQYGLIAEEVEEVAPELVTRDAEGRAYAVRYQLLAPMLLNELQRQERTLERQREGLRRQAAEIERLAARLERLEARQGRAAR